MAKILMINGSPNEHGCTYTALKEVADTLGKHNIETDFVYLGKKPVAGCVACRTCVERGKCIFDDEVNEVAARLDEYCGIVVGSPVYFAGPSGQLCSFLDRLFYFTQPRMAGKLAACVVSCRRGGASSAFDRLNKYFTICNMTVVGSQYWNQVHGNNPAEVRQDAEGLQTMRTLGENMAHLVRVLECADGAGLARPVYEAKLRTNFIR